jgi:diamine N-acetyltransferase
MTIKSKGNMEGSIEIRKANTSDLDLLYEVSRMSYTENFSHHWNEGGLAWYLESVYAKDLFKADLENASICYYIAFWQDVPAGFMKLIMDSNLPDYTPTRSMEIEKIYVRPRFHGKGLGKELLTIALKRAQENERRLIWLDVIDTNHSAIEFYKKAGFSFFNKTTLDFPYFKKELRGMWRMVLKL